MAKSVHLDDKTVKCDVVCVLAFAERMPEILKAADFILCTVCKGLDSVCENLLLTPHELTGDDFEVQARIQLGFQAVEIFGTANITASLKQIVTYVPYYVEKALSDSAIIGLPITLANFNDGIMERAQTK